MAGVIKEFLAINKNSNGRPTTETFCGFPHHLYLPRLKEIISQLLNMTITVGRSKEGAGQKFELLAFVNDVNQAATEGSDMIEHM